jgi:hypothetical protein
VPEQPSKSDNDRYPIQAGAVHLPPRSFCPPREFQFPVRIQKSCESSRYIAVRSREYSLITNDATDIS